MSPRPVILIGTDAHLEAGASKPREGVYSAYVDSVIEAGGLPLILPARVELLDESLALADGIVLPGGDDFDPRHYDEAKNGSVEPYLAESRVERDFAVLRRWFERDRPLLGICGGMQLMNVAFGGSMIQDLGDKNPTHRDPGAPVAPRHPVEVEAGSQLNRITGVTRFEVNSRHHQALGRIGDPLRVTARAPDGVVEAIEAPTRKFFLGVQWHPETEVTPEAKALFKQLVDACRD